MGARTWFDIRALDMATAEVYVYDEIGAFGVSSDTFKKLWDAKTKDRNRVELRINSPGGDVAEAFAIYNTIRRSAKETHVYVDGWAVSAASLIAMAGDTVSMAENALMMLHEPWGVVAGNSTDLRKQAEVLDKHRDAMLGAYTAKSGQTEAQVRAILAAETWYKADEAVAAGFADDIIHKEERPKSAQARFDGEKYRTRFKNWRPEYVAAVQNEQRKGTDMAFPNHTTEEDPQAQAVAEEAGRQQLKDTLYKTYRGQGHSHDESKQRAEAAAGTLPEGIKPGTYAEQRFRFYANLGHDRAAAAAAALRDSQASAHLYGD